MAGTMGAAATVLSVVGGISQMVNGYSNYSSQAKAADINADVAAANARNTLIESSYAQDAKLQEGKQYISNQYVRNLQSGAGGAGTTGDRAVAKSAYNLEKDLSLIAYNYETKAIDFLNQSKMYKYESKVAKANAVNSLVMGGLNIGNSILAGTNVGKASSGAGGATYQSGPMAQYVQSNPYARNSKLFLY
jgi:hypothetical protein